MRLPPYGRSIDQTQDTIWIWAGHQRRVYERVKAWGVNTLAFFYPLCPKEYQWAVAGRDVILLSCGMASQDIWIKKIAHTLLKANATRVAEVFWSPGRAVIGEPELIITHYTRN